MASRLVSALVLLAACAAAVRAEGPPARHLAVSAGAELRQWDTTIDRMMKEGSLSVRKVQEDTMLPGRQHERLAQSFEGVPIFGGEIVRQIERGGTVSVFGTLYENIAIDVTPAISKAQAEAAVRKLGGEGFGSQGAPALTIYPKADGGYVLAYKLRARHANGDIRMYFVDAKTGAIAHSYRDLQTQSAVGLGTGVLGDAKKVSARAVSGSFRTDDPLRPAGIFTYDFRGNLPRVLALSSVDDFVVSDFATDADNTWQDGGVVDAHVYAGYTYDYYFKRFGRRGLDNSNIPIRSIVHPVNLADANTAPDEIFFTFYINAAYIGDGTIFYGEGLPAGATFNGQSWSNLAAGLDVVSHELTHGVTDFSSQLIYENESGALNEAFSDIMGTSVEFFFQPSKADYAVGEDAVKPGGIRSMQNPIAYGDPDNYSIRFLGSGDNGGVHINSGIANHAFYLAIEGGTNRVSGLAVTGVGGSNREQIEKVFYRAFTVFLTPSSNFAAARAATIQAARELYQPGSPAERAITQAWTAVGVN